MALAGLAVAGTPAEASQVVTCGEVITSSTVLTNDVGPCATTDGVTLSGSNIVFNLNGHRIFGNGQPTVAVTGVHTAPGSSADTIENGEVFGFATGVYLDSSRAVTVRRMHLHDNVGPINGSGNFGEGLQIFQGGGPIAAFGRNQTGREPSARSEQGAAEVCELRLSACRPSRVRAGKAGPVPTGRCCSRRRA